MAASKKGGLGRGLDYLFSDSLLNPDPASVINPEKTAAKQAEDEAAERAAEQAKKNENSSESVIYININDIKPNSKQPRKQFSEEALDELSASIMEYGVIQPVLVRPAAAGYELVAGERRWRAARKAGLKEIPAIVRTLDDRQNAFYALIENMQRENLNAMEEAEGISLMMSDYGLSQQEAAKAVGKSRPYVANILRLLKLPAQVQELVSTGALSSSHARAIAGLQTEELQLEAALKASSEGWSVRKIESYTGAKAAHRKRKAKLSRKKAKTLELAAIEEQLTEKLGTKVVIEGSEKKGTLVLSFFSKDELEQLIETLMQ